MNRQIVEEAAEWFVEFNTGEADLSTKRNFDDWLRKSPENVRTYLELLPVWEGGSLPLPSDSPSSAELITWARRKDTVAALATFGREEERPQRFKRYYMAFAATILLALTLGVAAVWFQGTRGAVYATELGEQRSIRLDDGSTVQLNTRSRVRVRFNERSRRIELLQGQALFTVAMDARRPFTVGSGSVHVRAIGTQFDVYRKGPATQVTVVEGRVGVEGEPLRSAAYVSGGEQITVAPESPGSVVKVNAVAVTAWTDGRLIFDSTPLPEVAAEFNRYNARSIAIEDDRLMNFRISGSFGSSDPEALLDFLKTQPELRVTEAAHDIRITSTGR